MGRHFWRQYPSIKGNKIYSDLTFAMAVLLILSLHYGQIAFIKLFIMKLPGISERRSHWQNCISPGLFILLIVGVYGWQLLSSICSSLMAFTLTLTSICCKRDVVWGEWEPGLTFLQAFCYFFVTAVQKQLVNLMPFPDTGFCSGHFIVQPPLPVPFPQLMMETAFFISVCVLNMICS
jgi:hypothetical protein